MIDNSKRVFWGALAIVSIVVSLARAFDYISARPGSSKNDFVPDEATAIHIAEAVLIPIHGTQNVEAQRPFRVTSPEGEYWLVTGSPPRGQVGGSFAVLITKKSGCIVKVGFTK